VVCQALRRPVGKEWHIVPEDNDHRAWAAWHITPDPDPDNFFIWVTAKRGELSYGARLLWSVMNTVATSVTPCSSPPPEVASCFKPATPRSTSPSPGGKAAASATASPDAKIASTR